MISTLSLAPALSACVVLLILRYVYWEITTGSARRALIKKYGCLPPKKYPARDPVFGIDLFRNQMKHIKEHRMLDLVNDSFVAAGGNTFTYRIFGKQLLMTCEPENLKAILATNFESWSLGRTRENLRTWLGEGIFTTDGAAWQHSRDMLRPNFTRSQVADLEMFENHVQRFIQLIPKDGRTFDLAEPLHRLAMDIATEFLFGESIQTLSNGESANKGKAFAKVFDGFAGRNKRSTSTPLQRLKRMFLADHELKDQIKFVQSELFDLHT